MLKKRVVSFTAAFAMAASVATASLPQWTVSEQNLMTAYAASFSTDSSSGATFGLSDAGASMITVKLNPNGGKCSKTAIRVTPGKAYGTLPTPTRSGYTFTGWYDPAGKKVTSTTICTATSAHSLSALWSKSAAKKVTLKFNPNGGSVTSKSKSYTGGNKLGALPVARKDGYTFKGWYTKKSGGTRVNASTVLKDVKDRTFYAQYAKPSHATLRYSFCNSYADYGYTPYYEIPRENYQLIFGKDYGNWLYNYFDGYGWGGNCFGMSSTSAFLNTGKQKVQSFNNKQYFIKSLKLSDYSSSLGMDVRQFIECMQIAQYDDDIQNKYNTHEAKYSTIVNLVKKCQNGTGKPVVTCIMNGNVGHAILAYKWKKVSSTQERIYVYDCNYPTNSSKYITLYKKNGKYTGFSYEGYRSLTYFTFSDVWKVWSNRSNTKGFAAMTTDAEYAEIYSPDGTLCAEIIDGELVSYNDEVYAASSVGAELNDLLIYLPSDDYTIVNKDNGEIYISMYCDGTTFAATSAAESFTLSASGTPDVAITTAGGIAYDVTIGIGGEEYTTCGITDEDGTYVISENDTEYIA